MSNALSKSVLSVSNLASKAGQAAANAYLNGFDGVMNSKTAKSVIATAATKAISASQTVTTKDKTSKSTKKSAKDNSTGVAAIAKGTSKVYGVVGTLTDDLFKNLKGKAAKAANDTIGAAGKLVDESGILNPVITPLLDLTDLKRRAAEMKTILDTSLSTSLASQAVYATNTSSPSVNVTVKNNDKGIEDILNTLTDGFTHTTEAMSKFKIVMDTGAVVGQLSAPMDKKLGQIATKKGRK
jgi:hypothetical protein